WFIARHPTTDLAAWDGVRERVHDALRETVGDAEWERSEPDDLWEHDRLTLNAEGRESFLYWLYDDLAAGLKKLGRLAKGDYGDDGYAKRFPKFEATDAGDTPQQLFDKWVSERKPAYGTIESWAYVFGALQEKFGGRSAGSISPDEARDWIRRLITN